ncbi:MAG: methyltransferase domain-containing protein [Desulfurococcales archaeon]|nr:methyltransferase domain-containing protein [Desulfurococcales archaeon]
MIIEYKYIDKPRITNWTIEKIFNAQRSGLREVYVTLDLGRSYKTVKINSNGAIVDNYVLDWDLLKSVKPGFVYEAVDNNLKPIIKRGRNGFYKLKPVSEKDAPTIEINGIHMHRIIDITPWKDSYFKVRDARVKRGNIVLDTCMGLGYTAIHSLRQGARQVYTVEVDENVIEIAMHNPWSRELESSNILVFKDDIIDLIHSFNDSYFDRIIHDPPRFSGRTGDLYSLELYKEFYRVLKPGGILYHYTGEPGKHRGASIVKGIGKRLERAGFITRFSRRSLGYLCYKHS